MDLKKETVKTFEIMKFVFRSPRYKIYSFLFGTFIFTILYYFLVVKVANQNIWVSVMMSGPLFITLSILSIFITSFLSAVLFSVILFQFNNFKIQNKKGFFGFVGSGIAAFGVGCPTCGAFLFGIIGLPLALTYFPFRGIELQLLGICVLLFSIYFTSKSIYGKCKIGGKI